MNLSQMFKDDTGQVSSMRVVFVLWGFGVFALWAVISFKAGQMVAIPQQAMEVLGMCLGGKVVQSFSENNSPTTPPPTTTP